MTAARVGERAERIQARAASRILGVSIRAVQLMADRGEIPTAAKFGRRWTFDEATLRRWVKDREEEACPTTSTSAAKRGGAESRLGGATYDEAYERLLS